MGPESVKQTCRYLRIVRKQRTDFVAVPTGWGDPVTGDRAGNAVHISNMSGCLEPGDQETHAWCAKKCSVVGRDSIDILGADLRQSVGLFSAESWDAPIADIAVLQGEPGFAVIILLVDDPVEADSRRGAGGQCVFPECVTDPLSAEIRVRDVEPQKSKRRALGHEGHAGGELTVLTSYPKTFRVGGVKTCSIMQAGVPAFLGGPFDHLIEIVAVGAVDIQTLWHSSLFSPGKGERVQFLRESQQGRAYFR
jgi:hypothetical protein